MILLLMALYATACAPCEPCGPCAEGKLFALCDAIAACPETQTTYGSCVASLQGTACQAELSALQACAEATPLQCPLEQHACIGAIQALKTCTDGE